MLLLIDPRGGGRCVYTETIDLNALGCLKIQRGSHVEPNGDGAWVVDLTPVRGPSLGPFPYRSDALRAEAAWLNTYWLESCDDSLSDPRSV